MTLLDKHLEQIELCSSTISDLPFPPPRMFTNAMLCNRDITALIRDTEAHERALFSLAPQADSTTAKLLAHSSKRRTTTFPSTEDSTPAAAFRAPRKGTAVATVLGGDLSERIRREIGRGSQEKSRNGERQKDNFDVEVLLKGAERLCDVYPMPGAIERISALRARNTKVLGSLTRYEELVAEQSQQLGKMHQSLNYDFEDGVDSRKLASRSAKQEPVGEDLPVTEEDLRREEDNIAELEEKKRILEERVSGMEKDLGGLMR